MTARMPASARVPAAEIPPAAEALRRVPAALEIFRRVPAAKQMEATRVGRLAGIPCKVLALKSPRRLCCEIGALKGGRWRAVGAERTAVDRARPAGGAQTTVLLRPTDRRLNVVVGLERRPAGETGCARLVAAARAFSRPVPRISVRWRGRRRIPVRASRGILRRIAHSCGVLLGGRGTNPRRMSNGIPRLASQSCPTSGESC